MFNTNFGNNSNNRLYTLNNFGNHRRSIKSSLLRSKNKNNKNKTNTEHLSSNNNSDISNDSREQNIQEYMYQITCNIARFSNQYIVCHTYIL